MPIVTINVLVYDAGVEIRGGILGANMIAISGTYRDGKVTLNAPADWQEGATVRVELDADYVGVGMREEDWPLDPEGIAALLAKVDVLEPFLTPEEDERWRAALKEDREHSIANCEREFAEAEKLFK